jgi:hypothetical protein
MPPKAPLPILLAVTAAAIAVAGAGGAAAAAAVDASQLLLHQGQQPQQLALPACSFTTDGNGTWWLHQRDCIPTGKPLNPGLPGQLPGEQRVKILGAAGPRVGHGVPGSVVWPAAGNGSQPDGSQTLIADTTGGRCVTLHASWSRQGGQKPRLWRTITPTCLLRMNPTPLSPRGEHHLCGHRMHRLPRRHGRDPPAAAAAAAAAAPAARRAAAVRGRHEQHADCRCVGECDGCQTSLFCMHARPTRQHPRLSTDGRHGRGNGAECVGSIQPGAAVPAAAGAAGGLVAFSVHSGCMHAGHATVRMHASRRRSHPTAVGHIPNKSNQPPCPAPPQDHTSYFFLPKAKFASLSLLGAGAFVVRGPLPKPLIAPFMGPNYALAVDNSTFHGIFREFASVDTTVPFLIVLMGNVTLAPHPELPAGGFNVTRPVMLMGRHGVNTGIDFGGKVGGFGGRVCCRHCCCGCGGRAVIMYIGSRPLSSRPHHLPPPAAAPRPQVNTIYLSGSGNITFDTLALDNLFPGDEESMREVKVGMLPGVRHDRSCLLGRLVRCDASRVCICAVCAVCFAWIVSNKWPRPE